MDRERSRTIVLCTLAVVAVAMSAATADAAMPENLARRATASASSEHNARYLARFACDDKIPAAASHTADLDAAWCVLKARSGDRADFSLTWPEPVELSELIYFGRTAWMMTECWKDYEVYLDDAPKPVAKGQFEMVHGPQRVTFPKATARKLTIKFLSSYGGMNPGAAEIQAYAVSPTRRQLTAYLKQIGAAGPESPLLEETDTARLRELIDQLAILHPHDYAKAAEHRARLDRLQAELDAAEAAPQQPGAEERLEDVQAELERLERDVLLTGVDRLLVIRRHEITASHVYTYHYEGFRPGGGLYVASVDGDGAEPRLLVDSPEGQILDCDLSYDGRTALFSWRRRQDEGYHLWTVGVDGQGLKQLTDGQWHDYNACWLPDGGIAFLSTRNPQFAYCWHAPVGILHRMEPDGSGLRRLSANYLNDFTPAVLEDGRIIYSRWEYVDRPAIPIQSLWTINPDGTDLQGYFGNRVLSPGTFMEARSIPGTTQVLCTMTGHNGPTRGAIGIIDRSRGVNAQASIRNITPDTAVPNVDQGNGNTGGPKLYSCPMPLDPERFLLSARGPVLVRTLDGRCQSVCLSAPADGMQWFSAQPVRPRKRLPAIPHKPLDESNPFATVVLQDVNNGLEPYVERGEVTHIRVVREMPKTVRIDPSLRAFGFQFPVISCGATYAGKIVLGEVPVEPDGSACFQIPARTPVYFEALDAQGRAVQRMRTFTHLMPGEVQGCIGCHEHKRQAARDRLPMAYFHEPKQLTPPEWGEGGFDYTSVVQPVLDRHCVECHNPVDAPHGIDLTGGKTDFFSVSYDCLAREKQGKLGSPLVSWIPTYNGQEWNILEVRPKTWGSPASKLAEVIASDHPDQDGKPRVHLNPREQRRIFAWIDLNVPYYGTSETAYPDNVGCRRLYPADLDAVLADVAARRCASCHNGGKFPRREWTRITEPELNPFLIAPLAKSAGGSERCGTAVFADRTDPDYRKILATFAPIAEQLKNNPRMDMPGAEPSCAVSRSCQ